MDNENPSQEKVWNKIAVGWNRYRDKPLREVKDFLKNKKGKILDLGCGSGRNFVKINGIIYGIDFSEELLKYARENAKKKKIKVILKKAEAEKLPFDDEFFDFAMCIAVLHCIDSGQKRKKALLELFRVLKKNGEALITVWGRNQKRLKNKPKECFIPWNVEGKKCLRFTYLFDESEFRELLEETGFDIVKLLEDENIYAWVRKPI